MQSFAKYNRYLLIFILYAILITPLLVFSKFLFPFITSKTIFFRIAVEVAVFLYILLALVDTRYRPKMNVLSWLAVAFGGLILLTGITGVNFYKSFWGTIERGEGFLTVSHVIAFFLVLTWTLKTKKEWLNFLTGMVGVSFLLCIYAIKQKFSVPGQEVKFLFWRIIHPGEGRLSATLGNAAFMGAFSLANFYLSLLLLFARQNWWKVVYGVIGLLNLVILYYTQTRGALIALLISLFLMGLIFIFKSQKRIYKFIALGGLALLVVFIGVTYLSRNQAWVKNSGTIDRLVNISKKSITVESRLMAWDSSWNGWKDRFILGYGWENYNIAFNKYFHSEIFLDQGSQLWFDRAHNTIFDVAVTTGIFGILVYLSMFGVALYYLWLIIKSHESRLHKFLSRFRLFRHIQGAHEDSSQYSNLAAILACALIAHFIQNIFVFDVLATYIMIFGMLALVVFFKNITSPPENESKHYTQQPNILIASIALILLVFFVFVFNIKPLQANQKGINGMIAFKMDKIDLGISTIQEALSMNTYQNHELRQKLAENILLYNRLNQGLTQQEINKNFEIAIDEIQTNIREAPDDVQNYLYLIALYNASRQKQYIEKIEANAKKALELSPTRPQTYFEMGQAKMMLGQPDAGIAYFQKAVDLAPWAMETHWNLAAAYIMAGRTDEADKVFASLEGKNGFKFDDENNLSRVLNIYITSQNKPRTQATLLRLVELSPNNGDYWAKLAAVSRELGNPEKAREAALRAKEINPDKFGKEADAFLQMLDSDAQNADQTQGPLLPGSN